MPEPRDWFYCFDGICSLQVNREQDQVDLCEACGHTSGHHVNGHPHQCSLSPSGCPSSCPGYQPPGWRALVRDVRTSRKMK